MKRMIPSPPSDRPLSVLYWCEPHPIRNSFTEHAHIGQRIISALERDIMSGRLSMRLFSNNETVKKLLHDNPNSLGLLHRPTNEEQGQMMSLFSRWDDTAIAQWLELVRGKGSITEFYVSILKRLHAEHPIDVILNWSENGAVRKFAKAQGIPVLYGELGPTRHPFAETMYFDTNGTNGNAALRKDVRNRIKRAQTAGEVPLPAQMWLIQNDVSNTAPETNASLIDAAVNYKPELAKMLPQSPYLFVALQLADDLNTKLHSNFDTPRDFLEEAVKMACAAGYTLVVKGHPGAAVRPYNLRHEVEALEWLEAAMPDAVILTRDCGNVVSNYALANAAYSISINSSISFESMMLGVPPARPGRGGIRRGWLAAGTSEIGKFAEASRFPNRNGHTRLHPFARHFCADRGRSKYRLPIQSPRFACRLGKST